MTDILRSAGPWTPEEDGLLRSMAAAGESVAAIMKLLKRTEAAIRNRARILKIRLASVPLGRKVKTKRPSPINGCHQLARRLRLVPPAFFGQA